MFCGFLGVLFLSFRSCFRIFSVASVRTFFCTVIFPPPRPKFLFPRFSAVDAASLCGFPSESSFTPQFFRNSPFFMGLSFRRAAVPPAAYFLSCAAFSVVCCVILLPFFRCPAAFISASSLNRLYPSISPLSSAFPPPAAAVFRLSSRLACLFLGSPLSYIAFPRRTSCFSHVLLCRPLFPFPYPLPRLSLSAPKRGLPAVRVERRAKEFGRGK